MNLIEVAKEIAKTDSRHAYMIMQEKTIEKFRKQGNIWENKEYLKLVKEVEQAIRERKKIRREKFQKGEFDEEYKQAKKEIIALEGILL